MRRVTRHPRAQALALPRPRPVPQMEWALVGLAVAVLLAGLLAP